MQDHPIPQAVTSYEFHLIGNMTLKQFLELAAGFVIGVLIYQTNLLDIVKWPLIVFSVGLGAIIAFVPYEGRPMDQWFIALIKAIYRPTQFYWKKKESIPSYLEYTKKETQLLPQEIDLTPYRQTRIQEYIKTLPQQTQVNPLEYAEQQRVSSVLSLFDNVQVKQVEAVAQTIKPDLTLTPHPLQPIEEYVEVQPEAPVAEVQTQAVAQPQPVTVPQSIPTQVQTQVEAQPEPAPIEPPPTPQVFSDTAPNPNLTVPQQTQAVKTSDQLPFPQKPTKPNLVVGMVFDIANNIVDNAIVEISDEHDMPVRAVKTNTIGQFFISTPLKDGKYYLKVEKDGIIFPTQEFSLNQTILDPIEVRAQA